MAKDLFSQQTSFYAKYRPTYPAELFRYISGFVTEKNTAWDCATGNGQAALELAGIFKKVVASDMSEKQVAMAKQHPNVEYVVCSAEQTPFADNSFDLVTVAQAYHWFQFEAFRLEATRVAKPGAVLAIWGYSLPATGDPVIDGLIGRLYSDVLGRYWDPERKYIEQNYQTVPFDYSLVAAKDFYIRTQWSREDLLGYLHSWSSVQHYRAEHNQDPVALIENELTDYWKDNEPKTFRSPLFLKLGSIAK